MSRRPPTVLRAMLGAVSLRRRMRGPLRPGWSLETETLSRVLHHYARRSTLLPLTVQRKAVGMLGPAPIDPGTEIEPVDAFGVPGAWIRPRGADRTKVLYYLHGGGYSIGSIESHRHFIARFAREAGVTAFAIDYRLAPEHRFPAQRDDALAAWRWLLHRGLDPKRMVVAGESAGGGLTLSTLVALRERDEPMPAAAALISPWLDLTLSSKSIDENARFDYLPRAVLREYVRRVAGSLPPSDPGLSPVFAELRGLPPLFVVAGGAEGIVDDARLLAERARAAGVSVDHREHADQIHAFPLFLELPASKRAIGELAEFVKRSTER